jgi:hypothetical protein
LGVVAQVIWHIQTLVGRKGPSEYCNNSFLTCAKLSRLYHATSLTTAIEMSSLSPSPRRTRLLELLLRAVLLSWIWPISGSKLQDITFVIARAGDGHARTCARLSRLPVTDDAVPAFVTGASSTRTGTPINGSVPAWIAKTFLPTKIFVGVQGCCVAGLWCNATACFTQSNAPIRTFSNHGWLATTPDFAPVFACSRDEYSMFNKSSPILNQEAPRMVISSVESDDQGRMQIVGSNFYSPPTSEIDSGHAFHIEVKEFKCMDAVEVCNDRICRSCSQMACPVDSVCLIADGRPFCFQHCASVNDASCPCSTFCDNVHVYMGSNRGNIAALNLCTPRSFSSGDICSGYQDHRLQCNMPRFPSIGPGSFRNVSLWSHDLHQNRLAALSEDFLYVKTNQRCQNNYECLDHDACTKQYCNLTTGMCVYEPVAAGCGSIDRSTQQQRMSHAYMRVLGHDRFDPNEFERVVRKYGTMSAATHVDDAPMEVVHLPFQFAYFGNVVDLIAINPNGAINLPPVVKCKAAITSIEVSDER